MSTEPPQQPHRSEPKCSCEEYDPRGVIRDPDCPVHDEYGQERQQPPATDEVTRLEMGGDLVTALPEDRLPCGCTIDANDKMRSSVFWNPFDKVVQCHKCGHVYEPAAARTIEDYEEVDPTMGELFEALGFVLGQLARKSYRALLWKFPT
jgi:hypothetical protein